MTLRIISADDILFQGEVSSVSLPGTAGAFTVLPRHASLVSTLSAGVIHYDSDGKRHSTEIAGGIVDVDNNIVSVCVY